MIGKLPKKLPNHANPGEPSSFRISGSSGVPLALKQSIQGPVKGPDEVAVSILTIT
jgi:hypothetical protein